MLHRNTSRKPRAQQGIFGNADMQKWRRAAFIAISAIHTAMNLS
jgi:hypothetical protein